MDQECSHTFVSVILPVKFGGDITYIISEEMLPLVRPGSRVKVDFAGKVYSAVVKEIRRGEAGDRAGSPEKKIVYKEILGVEPVPPVLDPERRFWEQVAGYYLCTVGEVYKAAYPGLVLRQEGVKARKTPEQFAGALREEKWMLPALSESQKRVFNQIRGEKKPVLLYGVTGSGKTEIYVTLAAEQLQQGRNVLFMVPEIAISKQLQSRLKKIFGERLLTFHSRQTAAEKARIHKIVSGNYLPDRSSEAGDLPANDAVIVLGTRSALFLPYKNLGLVIVDEEHDSSYKQTDPAPRYQARDAGVMLAGIHGAQVVLGSATPSFESEYNSRIGRFARVELLEKFYGAQVPEVEVIDTIWTRKSGQMRGNFSQRLVNEIRRTLQEGEQVLVFRNRRSYTPVVQCMECGCIPKCPHCNVYLSFHKYNHTLRCHYCDYTVQFTGICPSCGLDTLQYKGAGTEKLEEELKELFPEARIARFDADVAKSKRAEEEVIKGFSQGTVDILVGTQMLSKGFDFEHLNLVAVMQADAMLGIQDFRADERALQMFRQLMGRTGRRQKRGKLIIQTNQKEHPVIVQLHRKELAGGAAAAGTDQGEMAVSLLEERREFNFAPYVRMVKVTVKHRDPQKLDLLCARMECALRRVACKEITGPFVPAVDKVRGEWLKCFYIKFARDARLTANKASLLKAVEQLKAPNSIILDVDPL